MRRGADIQRLVDCAGADANDLRPICASAVDGRAAAAAKQALFSWRRFKSGQQFCALCEFERGCFDRRIRSQWPSLGLAAHLAIADVDRPELSTEFKLNAATQAAACVERGVFGDAHDDVEITGPKRIVSAAASGPLERWVGQFIHSASTSEVHARHAAYETLRKRGDCECCSCASRRPPNRQQVSRTSGRRAHDAASAPKY